MVSGLQTLSGLSWTPPDDAWWMITLKWLVSLVATVYQREPALVAVFGALLVVPVLALTAYLVSAIVFRIAGHRPLTGGRRREKPATAPDSAPWPSTAWLEIEGQSRSALPSRSSLVRIGRHEDNEVRIADSSVHRYHAVIHRTPESAFVITDLSGAEGNGLLVNGERLARAELADGDLIQLGEARMRFESAPI